MTVYYLKPEEAMLRHAQQFADAYHTQGFGKNVLGVSYDEFISFIRIGKLCELVFANWLTLNGIVYSAPDMLIPHPGHHKKGADLVLTFSNQEVDIKAANKSFHKRILIREDQFQAHVHDIYIGTKYCHDGLVELHGFTTGEALRRNEPKDFGYGLCRNLMLDSLQSMDHFLALCKAKRKIE